MLVSEMTHDDIADFGAKRLRTMGYKFSCSNLTSAIHGEQPDVLGINSYGGSIVLESKVSRSDFNADKKKLWRVNPEAGMGDHRAYITPKGLLDPKEIPYGWMLWEVHGKTKPMLKIIKGYVTKQVPDPHGGNYKVSRGFYLNCEREEYEHFVVYCREKDYQKELSWMIKVMTRAIDDGFEPNNYANGYQEKV